MHKGPHGYRWVIPYNSTQNYSGSHAPMRLALGIDFDWSNAYLSLFPPQRTDAALYDPKKLVNEWRLSFSVGFFDFRAAFAVFPRILTPDNVAQLLVTDAIAGALLAQWIMPPDSQDWSLGIELNTPPDVQQISGNFGSRRPFVHVSPIYYHEEP